MMDSLEQYPESLQAIHRSSPQATGLSESDFNLFLEAADLFCLPLSAIPQVGAVLIREWHSRLSPFRDYSIGLGPVGNYVWGRLEASAGTLSKSMDFFLHAAEACPEPLYTYYAVHILQLLGQWDRADEWLRKEAVMSDALQCLRLRQMAHDHGTLSIRNSDRSDSLLIEAKRRLLSGARALSLPDALDAPREIGEEALRISVCAALAQERMDIIYKYRYLPEFHALPSAERHFWDAIIGWLDGRKIQANEDLLSVITHAPGLTGAFRGLADILMQTDADKASQFLRVVIDSCPWDIGSSLRLALARAHGGRSAEALVTLKGLQKKGASEQNFAWFAGRIHMRNAFDRVRLAENSHQNCVYDPTARDRIIRASETAQSEFHKLTETDLCHTWVPPITTGDTAWQVWICNVLQTPNVTWPARAEDLLDNRPQNLDGKSIEARWLEALLKLSLEGFESRLEGLESLVAIQEQQGNPALEAEVMKALTLTAIAATTQDEFARLCSYILPRLTPCNNETFPLFMSIILKSLRGDETVEEILDQFQTAMREESEHLWHCSLFLLANGRVEEAISISEVLGAMRDSRVNLIEGLAAFTRNDPNSVRQIRERKETVSTRPWWDWLETVVSVRMKEPEVSDRLFHVIESNRESIDPVRYSFAGLLAYAGIECLKASQERTIETFQRINIGCLRGNQEALRTYLHVCAHMGFPDWTADAIKNISDSTPPQFHPELTKFFCCAAASTIKRGDYDSAYQLLSVLSGNTHMYDHPSEIEKVLSRTEERRAIQFLLKQLQPPQSLEPEPDRFHCLYLIAEPVYQRTPEPISPLARRRVARADAAKRSFALPPESRWNCLRALAILHWEWGSRLSPPRSPLDEEAQACFEFADFLWRHILSNQGFWHCFAEIHGITPAHLGDVQHELAKDMFSFHLDRAKICLTIQDAEGCKFHLDLLERWTQMPSCDFLAPWKPNREIFPDYDPELAAQLQDLASAMIERWVSNALDHADQQLKDPDAIRCLSSQSVSADYEGAIRVLVKALDVIPENRRLLAAAARYYTDWTYELAVAKHFESARTAANLGCPLARRLAHHHLKPGDALNPDNKTVKSFFHFAWQLEEDISKRIERITECLYWGGPDNDLETSLKLVKALHALELGQHESAHGIVHEVECRADDLSEARDLLVVVHFKVGDAALARGDTSEAIEHLEKALQYEPNQEVIKEALVIAHSEGKTRLDAKIQAQLTQALKAATRKGIVLTPESVDQLLRLLNGQTDGAEAIELVELIKEIKREKRSWSDNG